MSKITFDENNTLFALDIGTRTVIGLVVSVNEGNIKILAQTMVEHQSRSMLDGQIHDIPQVAEAVQRVKADLEKQVKFKLKKVALAAAGRSLKTSRYRVDQELVEDIEIDLVMINTLELLGVQGAQEQLEKEVKQEQEKYYCVGHSVLGYYLNDYGIANLEGHRGKKIGADILATFLPSSVVTSLYAVLARVNLEPLYLTLEPIAASEVIIPKQLRLLNLALVDVGAGTSDIAISQNGSITAYGMVPMAGDEITEVLVESLMVDFMTAEQIKRRLSKGKEIHYQDILGIEYTTTCEEIKEIIEPVVEKLAGELSRNILELNKGIPPKSVMCVGGGAQVPFLIEKIASKLNLVKQRVVIRNRSNITALVDLKKKEIAGPEGVTVVGIAASAIKKLDQKFITVHVNGQPFTLFNTRQLTVLQALGLLNFNPRDLLAKDGKDLQFSINGKTKNIYGEFGKPAVITLNGQPANLQTEVRDNDVILVEKAVHGRDAVITIGALLEEYEGVIGVKLNGEPVAPQQVISQGDRVEIEFAPEEKTTNLELVPENVPIKDEKNSIKVTVNGQCIEMKGKNEYILIDIFNYYEIDRTKSSGLVEITRNGQGAEYTEVLQNGDIIEIRC
ncbi:FtsA related protein, predicted ATPase of the HSP70 family [Desulforamulus reducens MI-1]|uniref:FtsA related protein, predicted ATPase of the HSP70 family n=1 Tax=Desulforamulus reducens (strain ATCC BAA-1160 / DSM 100696 / MI-1) TaxID=349161 RepID=A4J496_DESRM|nr:cell division FtsA domain-containing protein [Desulforamulus reducens]ABO49899.1 FtsA related protein, predicted ATPase of the HSP70 family [Desulforamulus reducens MI-1]